MAIFGFILLIVLCPFQEVFNYSFYDWRSLTLWCSPTGQDTSAKMTKLNKKSPDIFDFIEVIHNLSGNWIHKALLIYINAIHGFQKYFRWYHPEQILPPYKMSHLHYVKRHLTRWLHTLFTRQIEPNDKGLGLQYITWESTAKKSSIPSCHDYTKMNIMNQPVLWNMCISKHILHLLIVTLITCVRRSTNLELKTHEIRTKIHHLSQFGFFSQLYNTNCAVRIVR